MKDSSAPGDPMDAPQRASRHVGGASRAADLPLAGAVAPSRTRGAGRASLHPGSWGPIIGALRYRDFRNLWTGSMFMWCAGSFQALAQSYLAYELTGSAGVLGVISLGYGVPMLALALFGGAAADRMDRKRLVQLFQAVEGAIALALAISVITDTITWYHILVASAIHGGLFSFMLPARQAIIPQLVDRSQITNAMALNIGGMSLIALVGPAIAGYLYASFGPEAVFLAMFGLFFTATVITGLVPSTGGGLSKSTASLLDDIKIGLGQVRRSRIVTVLLLMTLASTLCAVPLRLLLPVFVVEIYQREAGAMGLLAGIVGGGSLVGSLLIAGLGDTRRGLLLIAASFMVGTALLLLTAFPFYLAAMAIMLLNGIGSAPERILTESLAMDIVGDKYRGRVTSVLLMAMSLVPLGVLPLGIVADQFGARFALGIMAGLMLATSSLVLATQKGLREAR